MMTEAERASRKFYALLKRLGAYAVLVGIVDALLPCELEDCLDLIAYKRGIDLGEFDD